MQTDAVAEIKARVDIVDVVGDHVPLRRAGREHTGLCPFHGERTPSFTVSQDKQVWYCHGCGQGGDVISFVMRLEHADFRQALETLAERAGVELDRGTPGGGRGAARHRRRVLELQARAQSFFEHVLWSTEAGAEGRQLLARRGVPEELARRFGLGFAPAGGPGEDALVRYLTRRAGASNGEIVDAGLAHPARGASARDRFRHRLIFPIRDERGQTVAFGGRALGDAVPKYLNSPETAAFSKSRALYGLDLARAHIAESRAAVVVEGYFDVISCHRAGAANAVASSGTALTRDQVRLLHRYADRAILCFDADAAGQAATSRAVDVVAAEGCACRIAVLPAGIKDPDELARRDPAALAQVISGSRPEWDVLLDGALRDGEGGTVESRRAALERCVAVLVRVPVAAVREMYLQEAARRLEVPPGALAADVARALGQPRRAAQVVVSPPAETPAGQAESEEDAGSPPPSWEVLIGGLAVQRPALAGQLLEMGMTVGEIEHAGVRRLVSLALELPPGSRLPLHRLNASDQRLAAQLMMSPIPSLDENGPPHELDRALRDSVARLRWAENEREIAAVRRELRQARAEGREEAVEELAERLSRLAARTRRGHDPWNPGGREPGTLDVNAPSQRGEGR